VGETFAWGLAAGYIGDRSYLVNDGHVDVNGARAAVYGTWFGQSAYLNGVLSGGINYFDTRRAGLEGFAYGSTAGWELDALLGGGYDFKRDRFTFGPVGSLQYTYAGTEAFTETGSLAPLAIEENGSHSLRSLVGGRLGYEFGAGSVILRPGLWVGWQHEFLDVDHAIDSRFASGAGGLFRVYSSTLGRDSLALSGGLSVEWSREFSTYLYYDGELAGHNYTAHSLNLGLSWRF